MSDLCICAIQYEDTAQYHRRFEVAVTKGNHNEGDLKLDEIPNAYASGLDADISVESVVLSIETTNKCCVLCVAHALMVGDCVLFDVHMC